MVSQSLPRYLAALVLAAPMIGCGGGGGGNDEASATAVDTDGSGATEGTAGTTPTEGGGSDTSDDPTEGPAPVSCDDGPQPGPMPRLVRLTHEQYDLTVTDLLKKNFEPRPSAEFLADPAVAGFSNNAEQMVVKDRLGRDYRRAAERLAGEAVAPDVLAGLLPAGEELRICALLEYLGFDLWHPVLERAGANGEWAILEGLRDFQEHLGGELTITLLGGIGVGVEVHEVDHARMRQAMAWLKERAGG